MATRTRKDSFFLKRKRKSQICTPWPGAICSQLGRPLSHRSASVARFLQLERCRFLPDSKHLHEGRARRHKRSEADRPSFHVTWQKIKRSCIDAGAIYTRPRTRSPLTRSVLPVIVDRDRDDVTTRCRKKSTRRQPSIVTCAVDMHVSICEKIGVSRRKCVVSASDRCCPVSCFPCRRVYFPFGRFKVLFAFVVWSDQADSKFAINKMVWVTCLVVPLALWLWAKFLQPMLARFTGRSAVEETKNDANEVSSKL